MVTGGHNINEPPPGRGRSVRFELTGQARQAIDEYLRITRQKPAQFAFAGRGGSGGITTRQYARLVQKWVEHRRRSDEVWHPLTATHQGGADLQRTGNLLGVQLLLGHSRIESTVRHLGIEVEDAIEIAEKIDI